MFALHQKILSLVHHKIFQYFIISAIILNAIILGLETSEAVMLYIGSILKLIDSILIWIFIIEIILRLIAYGRTFFFSMWNIFDLTIVLISIVPFGSNISILRLLRILRILRLLSVIPSLRKVIEGLIRAIPGIFSGALIILLFFYIFSVMGSHLYGQAFPQWFGGMGATMFTLFQIMTLESWSMGIVRPVLEVFPHAWIFFVSYILITTFTTLNLFIAIIVNAMHVDDNQSNLDKIEKIRSELLQAIHSSEKNMLDHVKKLSQSQKNTL